MSTDDPDRQAALIRAVRSGREAMERLILSNQGWLTAQARRLFAAEEAARGLNAEVGVEGVVQEALTRAARRIHTFRGEDGRALRAWLRRILRSTFRASLDRAQAARRDYRREAAPPEGSQHPSRTAAFVDPGPSPSSQVRRQEDWERLQAGLDRLTLRQRVAVLLRALHDLPDAEIGRVLGCTANAAQLARSAALERLLSSPG